MNSMEAKYKTLKVADLRALLEARGYEGSAAKLKKEELMDYLADEPLDVLATFGAGNIDRFIEPITELLKKRS